MPDTLPTRGDMRAQTGDIGNTFGIERERAIRIVRHIDGAAIGQGIVMPEIFDVVILRAAIVDVGDLAALLVDHLEQRGRRNAGAFVDVRNRNRRDGTVSTTCFTDGLADFVDDLGAVLVGEPRGVDVAAALCGAVIGLHHQ